MTSNEISYAAKMEAWADLMPNKVNELLRELKQKAYCKDINDDDFSWIEKHFGEIEGEISAAIANNRLPDSTIDPPRKPRAKSKKTTAEKTQSDAAARAKKTFCMCLYVIMYYHLSTSDRCSDFSTFKKIYETMSYTVNRKSNDCPEGKIESFSDFDKKPKSWVLLWEFENVLQICCKIRNIADNQTVFKQVAETLLKIKLSSSGAPSSLTKAAVYILGLYRTRGVVIGRNPSSSSSSSSTSSSSSSNQVAEISTQTESIVENGVLPFAGEGVASFEIKDFDENAVSKGQIEEFRGSRKRGIAELNERADVEFLSVVAYHSETTFCSAGGGSGDCAQDPAGADPRVLDPSNDDTLRIPSDLSERCDDALWLLESSGIGELPLIGYGRRCRLRFSCEHELSATIPMLEEMCKTDPTQVY